MSRTSNGTRTSIDPSIPFSILDLKAQAVRLPVSKGAQILLSELLTWSGERGYCWWSISAIAKDLNWSTTVVWRRSVELQKSGFLVTIPRAGRSNYWIPLPGPAKVTRIKNEVTPPANPRRPFLKENEKIKRCTVDKDCSNIEKTPPSPEPKNDNAVKSPSEIFPKPNQRQDLLSDTRTSNPKPKANLTPDQWFLIQDIEHECRDFHSRGNFINLVRRHDEEVIRTALSVTRDKVAFESGVNAGAYFYRTLQSVAGDRNRPACNEPEPMAFTHHTPTLNFMSSLELDPDPEPLDPDSLKKGWRLHYRHSGVQGMLSLMQRCVPACVDITRLWVDVRETFHGMEESILIERLLDTVVTRTKHAEKTAEPAV